MYRQRGYSSSAVAACHGKANAYQSVLLPLNTLLLVGVGVRETLDLTTVATEEAVEVGADHVGTALLKGVALSASRLH